MGAPLAEPVGAAGVAVDDCEVEVVDSEEAGPEVALVVDWALVSVGEPVEDWVADVLAG